MTFIAWFEIVVGVVIAGLWVSLLATRQVPQVEQGRRDIWFHISAELVTAILLLGGGVALLVSGGETAMSVAAVAAGALLYTTVNSSGYYADRRQWPVVGVFGLLAAATVATVVVVIRGPIN